jgi:hypothetical protein
MCEEGEWSDEVDRETEAHIFKETRTLKEERRVNKR